MSDIGPPPLPRRRTKVWKVLLLAVGIPLGVVMLVVSLGLCMLATAKQLPVTEEDRAVLVTVDLLADGNDWLVPVASGETVTKQRFFDGSYDLTYEYEHPDDEAENDVYLFCTITVDRTKSDARISYAAGGAGTSFGFGWEGVKLVERNDLFRWGSKSKCSLLTLEDGTPIGNYFACLSGKRTFEWILSGVFYDDAESIDALLRPVLGRLEVYKP